MSVPRHKMSGGQGQFPEFILRDFRGMNLLPAREAIEDDELYWCENAMPLAAGNLSPVNANQTSLGTVVSNAFPTYVMAFNITGVPYLFMAFANSGDGWIMNLTNGVTTKIITALLSTNGGTTAVQYSNQGILIIDANGYWDYNVTTANTLTSWNNSVSFGTITAITSFPGNSNVTQATFAGSMSTAKVKVYYQVISAVINAAGTGYVVGDTLSLTDGTPEKAGVGGNQFAATIIVTSVGGGGAITGISLTSGGSYSGPTTGGGAFATGPSGTVISGGTGTTATFTIKCQAIQGSVFIVTQGSGVTNGTILKESYVGGVVTTYVITTSGIVSGTAIATYAGRVWLASGRTVFVSDINSYNSFGGAGTSFTINDSYLFGGITALYSANNYLYIFGQTSIDALSNVTVSATTGLTSFTRINITTNVGALYSTAVFGFYRSVAFYHTSGLYLLSGATPEKISEPITPILSALVINSGATIPPVIYGCPVTINGEMCAAWQLAFLDKITLNSVQRNIVVLFFRRRWWVYSFTVGNVSAQTSPIPALASTVIANGVLTMFTVGAANANGTGSAVYQGALVTQPLAPWTVKTRLWDGGAPLREKQSLMTAITGIMSGLGSSGVTFTLDTENGSGSATAYPVVGTPTGHQLLVENVNQAAANAISQYLGLTVKGDGTDMSNVHLIALRGKTERDFMQ